MTSRDDQSHGHHEVTMKGHGELTHSVFPQNVILYSHWDLTRADFTKLLIVTIGLSLNNGILFRVLNLVKRYSLIL